MRPASSLLVMLCALVLAACSTHAPDMPAIPDTPRYVPTLPAPPPAPDVSTMTPLPTVRLSPVDLPPPEAIRMSRGRKRGARRKATQPAPPADTVFLASRDAKVSAMRSAIVTFDYYRGAVYRITTAMQHPVTLLLPASLHLSAPLVLDTASEEPDWKIGFSKSGEDLTYQEKLVLQPLKTGLDATTPLLFTSGHFFLVNMRSQTAPGQLAVTWELPEGPAASPTAPLPVAHRTPPGPPPQRAPKIDLGRLHIQYKIEAGKQPVSWLPVEVYDDGVVTVIRFAEALTYTTAPVLSVPEGKRTLPVEYTVYAVPDHPEKGEFYLTRGLYPRLQLRDGRGGVVTITRLPVPEPQFTERATP